MHQLFLSRVEKNAPNKIHLIDFAKPQNSVFQNSGKNAYQTREERASDDDQ